MTYTEKELDQFLHGISLSLLSKKSAQHWRYDEETAKEIEWLEALEQKVRADMADRKTENSSEKPNNCEHITEDGVTCAKYPACDDCLDNPLNKVKGSERLVKGSEQTKPTISKMEQVDKDINVRSKDCETCKHYKLACELFSEICKYEPTTQTETQNSNLTFKTLEYCDICDHKGCKECIANALDEHCMPSQFNKQIEDECAKEYEELGLKELKELIEADRKTESNSEIPNNSERSSE